MSNFIVVGYYTLDTAYEDLAKTFIESLVRFNIPYHVEGIDCLGHWYRNTGYKPTFLKRMMKKFPTKNIVYVDVDTAFFGYPDLFEQLDCEVGVHHFDRSYHKRNNVQGFEVLSGTIFLKNTKKVLDLVDRWARECKLRPYIWDQKSLERILEGKFYNLPGEYCAIFDLMEHIKHPIIVHYQASRQIRKQGKLRTKLTK